MVCIQYMLVDSETSHIRVSNLKGHFDIVSSQGQGFNPWPGNFCQEKKREKETQSSQREERVVVGAGWCILCGFGVPGSKPALVSTDLVHTHH